MEDGCRGDRLKIHSGGEKGEVSFAKPQQTVKLYGIYPVSRSIYLLMVKFGVKILDIARF